MNVRLTPWPLSLSLFFLASDISAQVGSIPLNPEPLPRVTDLERFAVGGVEGELIVRDLACASAVAERCVKERRFVSDDRKTLSKEEAVAACGDGFRSQGVSVISFRRGNSDAVELQGPGRCINLTEGNCWQETLQRFPNACIRTVYTAEAVQKLVQAEAEARDRDVRRVCRLLSTLVSAVSEDLRALCAESPPVVPAR